MLKQPFYFLFCILFFLSAKGIAQLYYQGRTLTVANGLSDNRITCFYKDATGFIWIGTKNGLVWIASEVFQFSSLYPAPVHLLIMKIVSIWWTEQA